MNKKIVIVIVVLVLIGGLGYLLAKRSRIIKIGQPQEEMVLEESGSESEEETPKDEASLEDLAKCLEEKGIKFYGTSWCGWCNRQKQLFGEAARYLPYVECTDKETNQMTEECQKAEISGFPTWDFFGEKEAGFKSLEELTELSDCSLK